MTIEPNRVYEGRVVAFAYHGEDDASVASVVDVRTAWNVVERIQLKDPDLMFGNYDAPIVELVLKPDGEFVVWRWRERRPDSVADLPPAVISSSPAALAALAPKISKRRRRRLRA